MRETLRDWQNEWIETNGKTEDLEVVIEDSKDDRTESYVYEGSFAKIPDRLLDRLVIKCGRVLCSSIKERNGAYSLTI